MSRTFLSGFLLLAILPLTDGQAAESGEFKGSWVANGTKTSFPFGEGRQVYNFKLSGHVSLQTALGKKKDYWSECIGLADSVTGVTGRCVWKDLAGPEVYITLQSDKLQQGGLVSGAIVGGTGPLAGISGDLTFNWSLVITLTDADGIVTLTGETKNLGGHFRMP
ncbi:MAG TPA: hypothetical protein DCP92_03970 [Nitrospiraceae bacterium]|jgi:hypothetical protein|nr:hypothetical protein [Nitrospiraceae bacterium]